MDVLDASQWVDAIKYVGLLATILGVMATSRKTSSKQTEIMSSHMDRLSQSFDRNADALNANIKDLRDEVHAANRKIRSHIEHSDEYRADLVRKIIDIENRLAAEQGGANG